jgi:hypothetical protein
MRAAKDYMIPSKGVHWLTERLATFALDIENLQVLFPFAIFSALVGLIGAGLVTGL